MFLILCEGGFTGGDASGYNGTGIVGRSVGLNAPIIYVSFNYRLNGTLSLFQGLGKRFIFYAVFGFLGGKEVQQPGLGNLGLYDREYTLPGENVSVTGRSERMALEWVQKYISVFGGDPEKVIMSVSLLAFYPLIELVYV